MTSSHQTLINVLHYHATVCSNGDVIIHHDIAFMPQRQLMFCNFRSRNRLLVRIFHSAYIQPVEHSDVEFDYFSRRNKKAALIKKKKVEKYQRSTMHNSPWHTEGKEKRTRQKNVCQYLILSCSCWKNQFRGLPSGPLIAHEFSMGLNQLPSWISIES